MLCWSLVTYHYVPASCSKENGLQHQAPVCSNTLNYNKVVPSSKGLERTIRQSKEKGIYCTVYSAVLHNPIASVNV